MANFTAVYDSCALYPARLRNLLMHLALSGLYRARWTERIHDEWIGAILRKRPELTGALIEKRRQMDEAIPDALVAGYESLEFTLTLPDPDDRHVLAAAIFCKAGTIVTYNLKDFPASALAPHNITAQHPDEFIAHAIDLDPGAVLKAVRDVRASLKNPPMTIDELFDGYLALGLATTVATLKPQAPLL
ncbi:MAG: PIN domain-containing protein [Proteobacteria bacterium]|nr:PIN domain-containing protein [Pseudomonadota bacterium]